MWDERMTQVGNSGAFQQSQEKYQRTKEAKTETGQEGEEKEED